jgi:hypothetical protein
VADAGWYPDPHDPNSEHFWDGQNWSGQRRPAGSASAVSDEELYQQTTVNPAWRGQPAAPAPPAWQSPANPYAPYPVSQPPQSGPAGPAAQGWSPQPVAPHNYQQPWAAGPPAKKRGKRIPLIIVGVVAVLVAAGLITWFARPSSKPSLTYQGKAISAPADALTAAEKAVDSTVAARHGAKSADTRCYFAKPRTQVAGGKSSDVDSSLRCGPVLFVDGSTADEYLSVPLTASDASGGKTTLTPSASLGSATPQAVGDFTLVRPDGETPPAGTGGLSVPAPPPATKDILLATTLGPTTAPNTLSGAVLVGKFSKVTLLAAGEIPRYGSGADARSAPAGQKLIAFQVSYGSGDVDATGDDQAQLDIDGRLHSIPSATGDTWDVVAVPTSSTLALAITDDNITQKLELPSGKAGSGNIAVLARKNRTGLVGKSFNVPIHLSRAGANGDVVFHAQASVTNLYFWPPGHDTDLPSSAGDAYLSVRLNYTDADDPGKTFGFDPALLRLKLPDGTVVHAKNLAGAGRIYNVFQVPADYTNGTLTISGSEKVDNGITLRVSSPRSFRVNIRAN